VHAKNLWELDRFCLTIRKQQQQQQPSLVPLSGVGGRLHGSNYAIMFYHKPYLAKTQPQAEKMAGPPKQS